MSVPPPATGDRPPLVRTVAVLATTQLLGWATTYHMPVVFARPIERDLGIAYETVFLGVTAFLVVIALLGPRVGRAMDRHGARRPMAAGSLALAAGLVAIAVAEGPAGYLVGWTVLGVGGALALYNSAFVAITQIVGAGARRAIGVTTLITVASVLLVHPVNDWMQATLGWRTACLIYAGLHLGLAAPLHLFALPARRDGAGAPHAVEPDRFPVLDDGKRRAAQVLLVLAFSLVGLVGWGLPLHLVTLFRDGGIAPAAAVWIAGLAGPAQAASRLVEVTLGERNHPLTSAVLAFALGPIAFLTMLSGPYSEVGAALFVALWGLSAGTVTLTRASVPLVLFGRRDYGRTIGRLALPQTLAFAAAPILFARLFEAGGPALVIGAALALSLAALLAIVRLARLAGVPLTPLSPSRAA